MGQEDDKEEMREREEEEEEKGRRQTGLKRGERKYEKGGKKAKRYVPYFGGPPCMKHFTQKSCAWSEDCNHRNVSEEKPCANILNHVM